MNNRRLKFLALEDPHSQAIYYCLKEFDATIIQIIAEYNRCCAIKCNAFLRFCEVCSGDFCPSNECTFGMFADDPTCSKCGPKDLCSFHRIFDTCIACEQRFCVSCAESDLESYCCNCRKKICQNCLEEEPRNECSHCGNCERVCDEYECISANTFRECQACTRITCQGIQCPSYSECPSCKSFNCTLCDNKKCFVCDDVYCIRCEGASLIKCALEDCETHHMLCDICLDEMRCVHCDEYFCGDCEGEYTRMCDLCMDAHCTSCSDFLVDCDFCDGEVKLCMECSDSKKLQCSSCEKIACVECKETSYVCRACKKNFCNDCSISIMIIGILLSILGDPTPYYQYHNYRDSDARACYSCRRDFIFQIPRQIFSLLVAFRLESMIVSIFMILFSIYWKPCTLGFFAIIWSFLKMAVWSTFGMCFNSPYLFIVWFLSIILPDYVIRYIVQILFTGVVCILSGNSTPFVCYVLTFFLPEWTEFYLMGGVTCFVLYRRFTQEHLDDHED